MREWKPEFKVALAKIVIRQFVRAIRRMRGVHDRAGIPAKPQERLISDNIDQA
jgi:hypothetical protein